ncbi:CRISPR-associated endonuclease Cas2 [Raineyella sp. LH-20]|uniref:CRISPR-associated endonuclease Cas2 n=1 Tax=Raineyella sp. LH-20 TaxID=3081204 RepID=UPI002952DB3E|nr:CRISPR-associated endonuclease Cas2 [Raineyella sp. LH-20]WOP20060.1 CRISPR-associated endonuclease Cas2 [Raineyella sp. LH-20]
MSRRRYLIAYDIADPKRLRQVIKIMESYGTRLQYSVFLCDLSGAESLHWRGDILDVIELSKDSVVSIDLGPTLKPAEINLLGLPRQLPAQGVHII